MTMELDALHAGQPMRNSLDPCTSCAEWQVIACQRDSLKAALQSVLDAREAEAKAWFSYENAKSNFRGRGVAEGRKHVAAMAAASVAEREARLLLATLKKPNVLVSGPPPAGPLDL